MDRPYTATINVSVTKGRARFQTRFSSDSDRRNTHMEVFDFENGRLLGEHFVRNRMGANDSAEPQSRRVHRPQVTERRDWEGATDVNRNPMLGRHSLR